jgi:uncharacterized protein (DUF362 family)/NAD-dependent dihydropyrimidine dehydrogenase PreA subunit
MDAVSILRCNEYYLEEVKECLEKSFELIGGIPFQAGQRVLIKPNLIGPYPPEVAATTHPVIVEAIISILQAKRIEACIGESSGFRARDGTLKAFNVSGLEDVASRTKVDFIDFDKSKCGKRGNFILPEEILECEGIINLPKLKTHRLTGFTGAIKNLFGVIPGRTKTSYHANYPTIREFSEMLVDLHSTLFRDRLEFVVMDGVVGMEGNGPTGGKPISSGVIFSGRNGFAVDYVSSKSIGFNPLGVDMIGIACERGYFDEIEIRGEKDFSFKYKRPSSEGMDLMGLLGRMMKPYFKANPDLCARCYECVRACPRGVIGVDTRTKVPVWKKEKRRDCISCYCCEELCQRHAIEVTPFVVGKLVNLITGRVRE